MRPIIARAGIMVLFCALLAVSCAKKDDPITDSTGPTISNVVTVIAAPNATISWLTNEAATSQVDYCNTSAFG